ncbi:MAG: hypothetical protein FJ267_19525, partial [Planctomycetes bacterium]|nr:hypothetical protein [Planctomycetota bacterium]
MVPVEFRLHRMRVEGRPFFPRIIRSYNERPEVLGQSGVNVVWVPDPDDVRTVGSLRRQGLWLTATPPFARDDQGNPLESEDASLLPFSTSTSPILFHMMGTRLTAIGKPKIQSWANQVRDADRTFKRPLAADVADDERLFSRHLDLIGISRHVMNTEWTLNDYRQVLGQKRDRTWPGTLCFSWVQTEPSPEIQAAAATEGTIPVIEPEQIRGQVYAALAEGCRGLGFWTTTPIDGTDPVSKERFLAIQQLNQELALLGPWLATGQSVQVIPMLVDEQQPDSSRTRKGQGLGRFSSQPPQSTRDRSLNRAGSDPSRIASVIRSEFGTLVLPMWLEDHSQYVPGP